MSAVAGPETGQDLWLRRFHEADADAVRLVCLPYAGGSASMYHAMSGALAPSVEALAIQYPGRQDRLREPLIDNIPELAEAILASLEELRDRPLALFGHSMGATVAFELALLMEERWGCSPIALLVSGRRAPSRHRVERVHTFDDAGLVRHLAALSGTDPRLLEDPEVLEMILPVVRNDYRAIETYRGRGADAVRCPLTALTGDRDERVTPEEAEAWAGHTSGEFRLSTFSGGHFFINDQVPAVVHLVHSTLHSLGAFPLPRDSRNPRGE